MFREEQETPHVLIKKLISHFNFLKDNNCVSLIKRNQNCMLIQQLSFKTLDKLSRYPFGNMPIDLLNNPILQNLIYEETEFNFFTHTQNDFLSFWLLIENYLLVKSDDTKQMHLALVEKKLIELKNEMKIPIRFTDPVFIKHLYLTGDNELIELFEKYFPAPRQAIFSDDELPERIKKAEKARNDSTIEFLRRNLEAGLSFETIEKKIKKAQQVVRARNRQREELKRIQKYYPELAKNEKEAKQLIKDANRPYIPKNCNKETAAKIMRISQNIFLWREIKHFTSIHHIRAIFDDALYGRKTLTQFYLSFKPAALSNLDVFNGDGNIICFGPFEIDPTCKHSDGYIEIVYSLAKLQENPCMLFKLKDFGYDREEEIQRTPLSSLFFSHTLGNDSLQGYTDFLLFKHSNGNFSEGCQNNIVYGISSLPNFSLIAYNMPRMYQILILNFFRFIDNLHYASSPDIKHTPFIQAFYNILNQLDENQLTFLLKELGTLLSETSEFNFYGAHQIEFSAIERITVNVSWVSYTLFLPSFIADLKQGKLVKLKEAQEKIPQIFESYRFINYLLSQVDNGIVKDELMKIKSNCKIPELVKAIEKLTADVAAKKNGTISTSTHSIWKDKEDLSSGRSQPTFSLDESESIPLENSRKQLN